MDSLLLKQRSTDRGAVYLAVVCDGVGSMQDGAYAAAAAVRGLSQWLDGLEDFSRLGLRLRDQVLRLDRDIAQAARSHGLQTAATLSALLLEPERYCTVHVGDSRIYSLSRGVLTQLTRDHVSPGGKLTACLGRERPAALDYGEGAREGQLFLLCSDGLYKRLDPEFLCAQLQKPARSQKELERTMDKLVQHVVQRGETDNISLAMIQGERG